MRWAGREQRDHRVVQERTVNIVQQRRGWVVRMDLLLLRHCAVDGLRVLFVLLLFANASIS